MAGGPASADENYSPDEDSWNGHKIYLSPARHSDAGSRGECDNKNENDMALASAREAANGWGIDLVARGYKVQVGTGTVASAIANSNAWGANAHIPIHSNARNEDCENDEASTHGTVVIYWDTSESGSALSAELKDAVGDVSPGTNDFKCKNSEPCTKVFPLGELSQTNATAAYLEAEFHTWKTGTDWLTRNDWQWRIGLAVDRHYNYP